MDDTQKRGRRRPLADRLADKTPRGLSPDRKRLIESQAPAVRITSSDELAAAAVGALVLQHLDEFGQTRVFSRSIEALLERTTESLTAREVMNLEIEAYEIVDWLLGPSEAETDEPPVATREGRTVLYDPTASPRDLIEQAIHERFDVKIDYFSRRRGEMNTRRITPKRVDAEVYLHAWCHARRADRVFRMNRITRCVPIGGQPLNPAQLVEAAEDERPTAHEPEQMALLDGELEGSDT